MKCPYCDEEMQEGVVQSGQVVFFTEKYRSLFFYEGLRKGDVAIIRPFLSGHRPARPSHFCKKCNKIIIDLNLD